jgi:hypothetical protein
MGFLMTNSSKTANFIVSRSAGLARVRLRVPKNNSQPNRSILTREKLKPPLCTVSHWHSLFIQMPSSAILRIIQSP